MRLLLFLSIFLSYSLVFAQQGGVFNYINLLSTTLPTSCAPGQLRVKSGFTTLNICGGSNNWNSVFTGGAVSSVSLLDGSTTAIYGISGSPVTSSGSLTFSLLNEAKNLVFAGPSSGSNTQPTFRSLLGSDLPNPGASSLGGIESFAAISNQWINSISTSGVPSATQPAFSNISGTIPNSQLATASPYTVKGNNNSFTSSVSDGQSIMLGTPSFSDSGIGFQITGSATGYFQELLQNTNSGSGASTDIIVNNNLGTATTFYGDFGINSSAFTGTGSLNLPNATYVYSQSGDLTLGTFGLNNIHMTVNSGATDALIVNTSNKLIFPGLTGFLSGNGSSAVTASTTIPGTSLSGIVPITNGGTNSSNGLTGNKLIVSSNGTIGEIQSGQTTGLILIAQGSNVPQFGINAPAASNITGTLSLTTQITGILPLVNGGTATNHVLANNRVIVSAGSTIGEFSPGNSGQFLESQGIGVAPIWGSALSNPMTTTGDIIYSSNGSGTPARLAIGSSSSVLTVTSGIPSWKAAAANPLSSTSFVDTGNGYGSTATKIRRFTNVRASTSDITYADSAGNGDTWTIVNAGTYAITYADQGSVTCQMGITVNASSTTTNIASLTYANGFRGYDFDAANQSANISITIPLNANDVVRAHGDGGCTDTTNLDFFSITRVN